MAERKEPKPDRFDPNGPAPEKFQWHEGDIEWVKPPKSLKKKGKGKGGKRAK